MWRCRCRCQMILKFLMADDKGQVPLVNEVRLRIWEELPPERKINFDPRKGNFLDTKQKRIVGGRVLKYLENIKPIYESSNIKYVFHVSPLERIYTRPEDTLLRDCNIYYAYASFYLKKALARLNGEGEEGEERRVRNKKGEKISWFFINASGQFYNAENPSSLFEDYDRGNGRLLHRTQAAMEELVETYMTGIHKKLEEGVLK